MREVILWWHTHTHTTRTHTDKRKETKLALYMTQVKFRLPMSSEECSLLIL